MLLAKQKFSNFQPAPRTQSNLFPHPPTSSYKAANPPMTPTAPIAQAASVALGAAKALEAAVAEAEAAALLCDPDADADADAEPDGAAVFEDVSFGLPAFCRTSIVTPELFLQFSLYCCWLSGWAVKVISAHYVPSATIFYSFSTR